MPHILRLGSDLVLEKPIRHGGLVIFQSDGNEPSKDSDETIIKLFNKDGDCQLQISIRPRDNVIGFNSQSRGGSSSAEELKPLGNYFAGPFCNITILDHRDHFEILSRYLTVHNFVKRHSGNTTNVAYGLSSGQTSCFSEVLVVSSYHSIKDLALAENSYFSEVKDDPENPLYAPH
jgi:hypothetical protein